MTSEKRAFRVNFVDILLTLVIAAIVAVGAYMIGSAFGIDVSAEKEELTVEYTLQFRGLMPEFDGKVQVGEDVIDAQKRLNIGTVQAVWTEPFEKDVYNEETGEMVLATHPDYFTLNVRISSPGYITDEMYYVNGIKMAVGAGVSVHLKNFCATGYVTDMRIK